LGDLFELFGSLPEFEPPFEPLPELPFEPLPEPPPELPEELTEELPEELPLDEALSPELFQGPQGPDELLKIEKFLKLFIKSLNIEKFILELFW
jgi:hypothetical protein